MLRRRHRCLDFSKKSKNINGLPVNRSWTVPTIPEWLLENIDDISIRRRPQDYDDDDEEGTDLRLSLREEKELVAFFVVLEESLAYVLMTTICESYYVDEDTVFW